MHVDLLQKEFWAKAKLFPRSKITNNAIISQIVIQPIHPNFFIVTTRMLFYQIFPTSYTDD